MRLFFACTFFAAVLAAGASAGAADAPAQAPQERPRLALVLSGGGARGFSHIGALKALEELRVKFDIVTGTSMGSMVGGAYAAGYSAGEIETITLGVNWRRMFAPSPDRSKLDWRGKADDRRGLGASEIGVNRDGLHFSSEVIPSQELDIFLQRSCEPFSRTFDLSQLDIPFAAVATDLETGQKVVLQKDINLAQAMRCSMSVPGAFAPAQYGGRMLVDGGLVDNLPVGLAREMGAQKVVAINAGTPLSKREEIQGVIGVLGQVANILTEQNVAASIASLKPDDIYIVPDLTEFNSGDFDRAKELIQAGYDAVMKVRDKLEPYAEKEEDYKLWAQARSIKAHDDGEHMLSEIRIKGLERTNPKRVLAEIDIEAGTSVTNEEVAEAARDIWAGGDYQAVPFHFEPGPRGTEVLVFEPAEKEIGYSSLRFGGNLQTDFESSNTFNVFLAHTWGWLNSWGGEWRNEIQVGEIKRFQSEWYQPLGESSHWFVMPRAYYQWEPFDLYVDSDDPWGRFRTETLEARLSLGYEFPRTGRIAAVAGWRQDRLKTEIWPQSFSSKQQNAFVGAELSFDTLDNASFPTRGFFLNASINYAIDPSADAADDDPENIYYNVDALLPIKLSSRGTALLGFKAAAATQSGNFNLGGVFNLSGSPYGRWTGDKMVLGRVLYYHEISRELRALRMPVYVGASFEVGRAWDGLTRKIFEVEDDNWKKAASIMLASDTFIGPVYLVYGRTFGESSSLMFYWGRLQ